MGVKCEIKFDENQHGTYFAGQIVSGKVDISLDKPKNVRGIVLKICGFAKTHWIESTSRGTGKNRRSDSTHYTAREDYLASLTYLVGSDAGNSLTLSPGIHTYNFACGLPAIIPSSFEGTHGHVRYLVKVVLDRPWKFDQTYTLAFTVLKPVDLNYESPLLRMPQSANTEKQFWCGMCNSNPLTVSLKIPQTGYVPGQIIVCETEINNTSNIRVQDVRVKLKKIIKYFSQVPRNKEKDEIVYVNERRMGGMNRRSYRKAIEYLAIPAVPPTSTKFCKVLHITYEVELVILFRGLHVNLTVSCPITIGTVPLMSVVQQQPQATSFQIPAEIEAVPSSDNYSSLPVIDPIKNNVPVSTQNGDIPPPSYEEAVYMKRATVTDDEEEKHPISSTEFLPRYPVYRFENPPGPSAPNITEADS